jgi:uncharacterized repeat protein (TIGR01451 family)
MHKPALLTRSSNPTASTFSRIVSSGCAAALAMVTVGAAPASAAPLRGSAPASPLVLAPATPARAPAAKALYSPVKAPPFSGAGPCFATHDGVTVFDSANANAVQQAVDAAPANGTVKVAGTCAGVQPRAGITQTVYINKALTLAGGFTTTNWTTAYPITQPTTLDALSQGRVIFTTQPVTVSDLTAQRGNAGLGSGGGGYFGSTAVLTNVAFFSNTANERGGGAAVLGSATLNGGLFQNNQSADGGGGLYAQSMLALTGTQFISNTAQNRGGGAAVLDSATLNSGLFQNNRSNIEGGGLFAASRLVLTGTQFISNTAAHHGGGAYANGTASVNNATFISNTSTLSNGGGLYAFNAAGITGTQFISNTASGTSGNGGGAFFNAAAQVTGTTFISNFSNGGGGGGAFISGSTITSTTFTNNRARTQGGGAAFSLNPALVDTQFTGNRVTNGSGGGAHFVSGATLTRTTFLSNSASLNGGGAYLFAAGMLAGDGTFISNTAGNGGGAYFNAAGTLTGSISFISNTAAFNGGGAYAVQTATLNGGLFQNNTGSSGGGLYTQSTLVLTGTQFLSNTAAFNGGGAAFFGAATLNGGLFQNNQSTNSGGGNGGGLYAGSTVVLTGTQFLSNTAAVYGGGANALTATLNGGIFQNNRSLLASGGGLFVGFTLALTDTQILSNTAPQQGGGAFAGGAAILNGGVFRNNQSTSSFAGGLMAQSMLVMSGTQFLSNIAVGTGGGASTNGAAILNSGLFQNNQSTGGSGGGLFAGTLALTGTQFLSNTARFVGGGAWVQGAATLNSGLFQNNQSTHSAGGGLSAGTLGLTGTQFFSNTAAFEGGGAFALGAATLNSGLFQNNQSTGSNGGGLFANSTLALSGTQFLSNTVAFEGGGAYAGDAAALNGGLFQNNQSTGGSGGGLFANSTLALSGTQFTSNTAAGAGGGLYLFQSPSLSRIVNSVFARNTAGTGNAMYLLDSGSTGGTVEVIHTTVASPALAAGSAVAVSNGTANLTNTLIASHTVGIERAGGTVRENFTLFSGVATPYSGTVNSGANSITGTAGFANPAADDYRLTAASSAIDAGTNAGITTDFFGNTRPQGFSADIGYDESPFTAIADVAISKVVTPSSGLAGSAITYTLAFSNAGPGIAAGVLITDSLPASVTISSVSSSGATITQTSGAPDFAWQVSNLAPNAGGVITLAGTISASAIAGSVLTNTASITASNDSNAGNNVASAAITVTAPAVCFATPDNGGTVFDSANADAVQQAVDAAATNGTVKVAGVCAGVQPRAGTTQTVHINKALTLAGGFTNTNWTTAYPITQPTTLDALTQGRVIFATQPMTVNDLTVQNGNTTNDGGGARFGSTVTLSGVRFLSNTSQFAGGGALAIGAVTLNGGLFQNNQNTGSFGGGLYTQSTLVLTGTQFYSNTALFFGGGAVAVGAAILNGGLFQNNRNTSSNGSTGGGGLYAGNTLALTGTQFYSNTAAFGGGAHAVGSATLNGGSFISNTAPNGGGAWFSSTATLAGTVFTSNTASQNGGGGYFGSTATITNASFAGNTASSSGGGASFISFATVISTNFISNTASINGGGARFNGATLTGTRFTSNTAVSAGGAWFDNSATLTGTTFTSNIASSTAGGARFNGVATLRDTTFISNTTGIGNGGGAYFQSTVTLTKSTFINNTANGSGNFGNGGGAFFTGATPKSLVNVLFARNTANTGAAIFVSNASPLYIIHSTVASSSLSTDSAIAVFSGTVTLTNTLISSHTIGIERAGGTVNENYTLFSGVATPTSGTVNSGGNSITGTAGFVDAANDNYRLTGSSSAVNMGVNAGITTDFDGNPRPIGAGFDIGAFEFNNGSPVANAGQPQTVTVGTLVTLTGVASNDAENGALIFGWSQESGAAVSLSDNTAVTPTFTAPNTTGQLVFKLVVTDTAGERSAPAWVTMTVTNGQPIADAGAPQSVAANALVTLTGVASSDPDDHALTFGWTQMSGAPVSLNNNTAISPTFTAPITPGELVFQLVVTDAFGSVSAPALVTVTVLNGQPVANAGTPFTATVDTPVTLNSTASSDPDGHALTRGWTQVSGAPVTLSSGTAVSPAFTAPSMTGELVFQLVVTDAFGAVSATALVTVSVVNGQPVADAGAPQTVIAGALVTLTGIASSDPDSHALTFGWTQVIGAIVSLSNNSAISPTFTAPVVTSTLVFQLVVTDAFGMASSPALVTITVGNSRPVANAGAPQTVNAGALVTLAGVASNDPDGHALTFGWSQVSGDRVTLSSDSVISPTFTAPITPGELVFQLVVTDAFGLASTPAWVTITVQNRAPTANAGTPQSAVANALVTLDGSSSSDPDGHALTYGWSQVSGTAVTLSSNSAVSPAFTAPGTTGQMVFQLIVTDTTNTPSAPALVTVTVINNAPVADAGAPQTIVVNTLVTLNGGNASDPDGHALTFGWSQVSGTPILLSSNNAVSPTFTAPNIAGTLVFQLVVTDAFGAVSAPAVVTITVTNGEPTADAGAPQTVFVNDAVTLNGSASSDPEGQALSFGWTQVSGTPVTLSSNTAVAPAFTAPATTGTLVFQLVVTDAFGLVSQPAWVTVTVEKEPTTVIPPNYVAITLTTGIALLQPSTEFTSTLGEGSEPVTFVWDFGDGSPIYTGTNASHVYAPGSYSLTLTATNSAGSVTTTIRVFVPWRILLSIMVKDSTLPLWLQGR